MGKEIVISVKDVKKSFKIYYDRNRTLKDILHCQVEENRKEERY